MAIYVQQASDKQMPYNQRNIKRESRYRRIGFQDTTSVTSQSQHTNGDRRTFGFLFNFQQTAEAKKGNRLGLSRLFSYDSFLSSLLLFHLKLTDTSSFLLTKKNTESQWSISKALLSVLFAWVCVLFFVLCIAIFYPKNIHSEFHWHINCYYTQRNVNVSLAGIAVPWK